MDHPELLESSTPTSSTSISGTNEVSVKTIQNDPVSTKSDEVLYASDRNSGGRDRGFHQSDTRFRGRGRYRMRRNTA